MKFQKGVLSLATLALLAACSGHKHKDNQAGSGGESPVAVKFTQTQGAALADINGRLDFGGQVAVSSYSVSLACDNSHTYTLKGGRMLVRIGESGCASTLKQIVVTDQHGLKATFANSDADSVGTHTMSALKDDGSTPSDQYPNLRLDISGVADDNGQGVSYTYTLRDSAQGNNTVGTNDGDIGHVTQVSFAGVPLPDVSPNKATAWAVIDGSGTAGTFSASIAAESTAPCGSATYAVELYAQTGATSSELAASGVPAQTTLGAVQSFDTLGNTSIIQDCRGLTTNLYLKLSCTGNTSGPGALIGKTSYKLIAIQSQIPNSPYTPIGDGTSPGHVCANAAKDGLAAITPALTADDAAAHPALFVPPPVFSGNLSDYQHIDGLYTWDDAVTACATYTGEPGAWRLPTINELLAGHISGSIHWSSTVQSATLAVFAYADGYNYDYDLKTGTHYVSCVK